MRYNKGMFMTILAVLVFALLVGVAGFTPRRSRLSPYEFRRRVEAGDKTAQDQLWRERLLEDVLSMQRVATALLLVIFVACALTAFGWPLGLLVSLAVALGYGAVARLGVLRRPAQRLYERHEPALLAYIDKYGAVLRRFRHVTPDSPMAAKLGSREELLHLVETSGHLLTSSEKTLFAHGLAFEKKQVGEVMTPRARIASIDKKELLGPLVLDDLHKTGHTRFPVTDGDLDHIVGLLHIQDLLTLDKKRSLTAEKAMEPRVHRIREDQTLGEALAAFLRARHHLFVVTNENGETAGLLSLEDVIKELLGPAK